jgi:hypothetical protein
MARDTIPPESGVWPDRRAHRRVALDAPALIDARHSYATARCQNVSEGGLAVQLERPLAEGTRVELYFELPTGVAIEIEAEVVRSEGTELGLRFVAPGAAEHAALESYVSDPAERPRLAAR